MDTADLAAAIDHTLLTPEASTPDVEALCRDGIELGVAAVCVLPTHVATARLAVGDRLAVATVIGFPSGAHVTSAKAAEASLAVGAGASELDMVVSLGAVADGAFDDVAFDIATVRAISADICLKAILETGLWDDRTIVRLCEIAAEAGADFVKTSTGFHPSGGATLEAVRTMRSTVGDRLGVKASGGIRDRATAEAMIAAGATRLGASSSRAILEG